MLRGQMLAMDRARELWRQKGVRGLLPSGRGVVDLFGHASTYLLVFAFVTTAVAKTLHMKWIRGVDHQLPSLVVAVSLDLAVYLGIAAGFSAAESRWSKARRITIPVAAFLALFSVANAVYLSIAGDQASRSAVDALFARFGDVVAIFRHAATPAYGQVLGLGLGAAITIYLVSRRFSPGPRPDRLARTIVSGSIAAIAGLIAFVTPRPQHAEMRRLGRNVLVTLVRAYVAPSARGSFSGYDAPRSASRPTRSAPARTLPNIILLVLESTRWDYTSLYNEDSPAPTPHLAALAENAFRVETMRAVVPHTTKALFTMLCGQLPLLQRELWELSADIQPRCLPRMLGEIGYHTGFFQSAQGLFEQRARLVDKLGYDHFVPWEDIRGQRLGYIASDDASMLRPLRRWLDGLGASGNPKFITLLTSSPHHPYKLPTRIEEAAVKKGLAIETDAERYARLVEGEDELIGKIQDVLEFRSMSDDTILIILGDHGEGFGGDGAKQHDQNLYEAGIRVPWVVAGPGIESHVARGNANALDFLPTVLDLLDLPDLPAPSEFPGVNLAKGDVPANRPRWLSCWFSARCHGFVVDSRKVMFEPDTDEIFYFDLATDPEEDKPLPLTEDLKKMVQKMHEVFEAQRISDREIVHPELRKYGLWWCPKDDDKCKHPRARHPDFRYKLEPKDSNARPPMKVRPKTPEKSDG